MKGFIGTGVMGTGIINNLLKHNRDVYVYNRTKAHANAVIKNGANWLNSPAEIASQCDVIFTMVGFPKAAENFSLGSYGPRI